MPLTPEPEARLSFSEFVQTVLSQPTTRPEFHPASPTHHLRTPAISVYPVIFASRRPGLTQLSSVLPPLPGAAPSRMWGSQQTRPATFPAPRSMRSTHLASATTPWCVHAATAGFAFPAFLGSGCVATTAPRGSDVLLSQRSGDGLTASGGPHGELLRFEEFG